MSFVSRSVAGDKLRLVRGKTLAGAISPAIEWLHLAPINKTFVLEFDPFERNSVARLARSSIFHYQNFRRVSFLSLTASWSFITPRWNSNRKVKVSLDFGVDLG